MNLLLGHRLDKCGNCLLPSDPSWNGCLGCDGVANSNWKLNSCFECVPPESNLNDCSNSSNRVFDITPAFYCWDGMILHISETLNLFLCLLKP